MSLQLTVAMAKKAIAKSKLIFILFLFFILYKVLFNYGYKWLIMQ